MPQSDRSLSKEAATWRVRFRDAQKEIESLRAQLAELDARAAPANASQTSAPAEAEPLSPQSAVNPSGAAAPAAVAEDPDPEYAALVAARDAARQRYILRRLEESGALIPDIAADVLRARNQLVVGADGTVAIVIDGAPQAIDTRSLSRVLPDQMMKASGVRGAGTRGSGHRTSSSFDYERGLNDQAYFDHHREEMEAEFRRRNGK